MSAMPSHLRRQSAFEPIVAPTTIHHLSSLPPAKKQKMSLTQTYYVASTARSKLGHEAQRADHNLRILVGHANLLDNLMVELADAEREQENWFNQSVKKASKPEEPRHVQWIDSIAEEDEEEDDDSDMESEDGSDIYDEDVEMFNLPLRKIRTAPVELTSIDADFDEAEFDDEFDGDLVLTRVSSKSSPPELTLDSDSESEDESMPTSPEQSMFEFELSEKARSAIVTTALYDNKSQQGFADYFAQQPQQPIIATC